MTTITINEHTKAVKTLLELAKLLSLNNKTVEIIEENPYNPEFVKKIH
ncbi:DNA-binding XRE family transcriptional regulator [Flavobacterium sp. PL11]|nr:DNA-binding XRE family transcriptional regulator [Flavobacterium sp. PL11]